ncbi:hypothetical protein [Pedobacter antarcticus]|uniref:hypothetical protein n=1 Tax=Pedobacter antarcticus TaxID=34086 RepID=UPI001C56BF72|nr:hypothetical protein [Pedobacter antarcticus]
MKIKKLSLSNVKNVLSRAELKSIMAGSGTGGDGGSPFPPGGTGSGGCITRGNTCSYGGYCCSGLTCKSDGGYFVYCS